MERPLFPQLLPPKPVLPAAHPCPRGACPRGSHSSPGRAAGSARCIGAFPLAVPGGRCLFPPRHLLLPSGSEQGLSGVPAGWVPCNVAPAREAPRRLGGIHRRVVKTTSWALGLGFLMNSGAFLAATQGKTPDEEKARPSKASPRVALQASGALGSLGTSSCDSARQSCWLRVWGFLFFLNFLSQLVLKLCRAI